MKYNNSDYAEDSKNSRGKNLIKIILLVVISILIIIGVILLILKPKNEEGKKELKQNTYTMYVKINPLVKITVKEEYYECTKNETKEICSEKSSKVILYDLLNDDAKDIYSDIDLNGKNIIEALVELCDTAKENEIEVEQLEITTDWENILSHNELTEKIQEKSKYKLEVTIEIDKKDAMDTNEILNKYEEKSYIVTFNSDEGSVVNEQIVNENEKVTKPESPTKEGYEFVEWQLNEKTYDFDSKVTENIELKAVWKEIKVDEKSYTVTFNSNGGTKVTGQAIKENGKVTKPENPTKEGYEFVEWQLSGKTYNFDSKVTKNIELKAVWKKAEKAPSTINKINLNDNIYVSLILVGPIINEEDGYIFTTNGNDVFADYFYEFDDSNFKMVDSSIFNEKYNEIEFDEVKEQQVLNSLKNITKLPVGISNFKYKIDASHKIQYQFKSLFIYDEDKFASLDNQLDITYNSFINQISNVLDGSFYITVGAHGGPGDTVLLTEEICKEYNLTCDRW